MSQILHFLLGFVLIVINAVAVVGFISYLASRQQPRSSFIGGSAIPRDRLPIAEGERRALIQVARGLSHKMAADKLGIARRTLSNQINAVYVKKGVNNITSAVTKCLRDGDITLDDILQPEVDGAQLTPATGSTVPIEGLSGSQTQPGEAQ